MRKTKSRLVTVGILAVLLLSVLIGSAIGKYTTTVPVSGTVTFKASLATSITLQEHKATRNADGSYTLSTTETVTSQSYTLLPGLDIPKDPYITITGKTPIEAYLFLVVKNRPSENTGIICNLADCWKPVTGYTDVYVYSDANGAVKITDQTAGIEKIKIIQGDKIYVNQGLNLSGSLSLSFSACMAEAVSGTTAAEVYQTNFVTN